MIQAEQSAEKRFCFLSGLPRSGSTLLSALLNEHPDIHASTNSPVLELIHYTEEYLLQKSEQYKAFPKPESAHRVLASLPLNYYCGTAEPVIVDKSRGWVNQIKHITNYITDSPKIICPVRSILDIVVSFLALVEHSGPDNYIDGKLKSKGITPSVESRFAFLMDSRGSVGQPYLVLRHAFQAGFAKHLLLVEYDDLVTDTQGQMDRIYDFIGVPRHVHDTGNVRVSFQEDDSVYGLRDMHLVRPTISRVQRNASDYLSRRLQRQCKDLEFWRKR